VNLYDAHDPYPGIPPGLDWAPPQPKARLDAYTKDPANPYFAYIKGLMPEADKPAFLTRSPTATTTASCTPTRT
jgi:hypothetical protein